MNRFSLRVGPLTLVAPCAEELRPQAEWLLGVIGRMHQRGLALHDGEQVRFGWSVLTVRKRDGEAVLCEPDFAGDPFSGVAECVTWTLWVQAQQADVLRRLGLEGEPAAYSDKVVFVAGCLGCRRIYLERQPEGGEGDSGWFIGPAVGEPGPDDRHEAAFVCRLLALRPAALKLLALPAGYLAVLDGDEVECVLDPRERDVWNRGRAEGGP